ncbi:MAG: hypothetical protein IKE04_05550 [Oscillospiraceae bacterium]|nr:hypothetical protein [Oscillospiraceae bacterium]
MGANRAQRRQQERAQRRAAAQAPRERMNAEVEKAARILEQRPGGAEILADMGTRELRREIRQRSEALARLERNGITAEDLKENYRIGHQDGFKAGQEATIQVTLAALCLVLHECHGFGATRCHQVLTDVVNRVIYNLDSAEAVQEVWDTIGLRINLRDPFDQVEETRA